MASIREILVLHHTHTDIGYTHPQPVLWELQRRFIDRALEFCDRTADWPEESRFRWTCECTAPLLHWLERAKEPQLDQFRAAVARGQMGCGAWWVHQAPLVSLAQVARALAPVKRLREELGLPLRCAISHDINGLPWPVVPLLREAGIELQIFGINIVFGGFPLGRRPLAFRWRGPEGTPVLAFSGEHYEAFGREAHLYAGSTDRMERGLREYVEGRLPEGYPHDFVFLTATHPFFVDNNGPCLETFERIRQYNAEGRTPRIRTVQPEALLERLRVVEGALPEYAGDWTDFWNFGCASSLNETRVARRTRDRLAAAELLLACRGASREDAPERLREAQWHLDLWEEHTWGASASVAHPGRDGVLEQWNHKAHYAWQARSLASLLLRDQLEELAGNPPDATGAGGVLLLNPGDAPREECVSVPRTWLAGRAGLEGGEETAEGRAAGSMRLLWHHMPSTVHQIDVQAEVASAARAVLGPVTIPARSWRILSAEECGETVGEGCAAGPGFLESPRLSLKFDPASGRVIDLRGCGDAEGWLSGAPEWGFGELVRESPAEGDAAALYRGREALFEVDWARLHRNEPGWQRGWEARREGCGERARWSVEVDGRGAALHREWEAPGLERAVQTVRLRADRATCEVETEVVFRETVTPESFYLVFPLALGAGWNAHFDTAGVPVEFGAEQLPGTARDFVTVARWACMHDSSQAFVLACPDAPLVQLGGFRFGGGPGAVSRTSSPLLLGWFASNYWFTNFRAAQPGSARFRYELGRLAGYDLIACSEFGERAAVPVEAHPVITLPSVRSGQLVSVQPRGVRIECVEPLADRRVRVRLLNPATESVRAEVGFGVGAERTVDLPGRATRTVVLGG